MGKRVSLEVDTRHKPRVVRALANLPFSRDVVMRVEGESQFIQQIRPRVMRYNRVNGDKYIVHRVTFVRG